jgi:hypothetical protein
MSHLDNLFNDFVVSDPEADKNSDLNFDFNLDQEKAMQLGEILEINKALKRLEKIKELTDEIDNFESKLRLLDELIRYAIMGFNECNILL